MFNIDDGTSGNVFAGYVSAQVVLGLAWPRWCGNRGSSVSLWRAVCVGDRSGRLLFLTTLKVCMKIRRFRSPGKVFGDLGLSVLSDAFHAPTPAIAGQTACWACSHNT